MSEVSNTYKENSRWPNAFEYNKGYFEMDR